MPGGESGNVREFEIGSFGASSKKGKMYSIPRVLNAFFSVGPLKKGG